MPKQKLQSGELIPPVTITKIWIEIPKEVGYHSCLVQPEVADYIEKLEDIIKGYEKILDLKNSLM